jgi:hypothetical protein
MGSSKNQYSQLNIKKLKKNIYKLDPTLFDEPGDNSNGEAYLSDPNQKNTKCISARRTFKILIICIVISFVGIFGFLLYIEYTHVSINGQNFGYVAPIPDYRSYTNDYWGISLQYPGTWTILGGSNNENNGGLFLSSANVNFKEELEPGEALIQILPQVSQGLGFEAFLTKMEQDNYNPGEILSKTPTTVDNLEAKEYIIQEHYPQLQVGGYVDMFVINKDSKYFYEVSLITADKGTHDKYWPILQNILKSAVLSPGTVESQ